MRAALDPTKLQPPTEAQAKEAAEAARALAPLLSRKKHVATELSVRRAEASHEEVTVTVPKPAFELFVSILEQMSLGNAVTVIPVHAELTTQEAADLLNVSRPYLVRLLDSGKIPFHMVGTHRRVLANDIREYQERALADREKIATELTEEAEKLGLGYGDPSGQ